MEVTRSTGAASHPLAAPTARSRIRARRSLDEVLVDFHHSAGRRLGDQHRLRIGERFRSGAPAESSGSVLMSNRSRLGGSAAAPTTLSGSPETTSGTGAPELTLAVSW